ncbi:hypothetical protein BAUCODRAFT_159657 [Baudoinia panamericana UAMH 10762]|uniref:Uncharacterized protein n=1 Tax=Baudoinia panamericana (strain UAMH 10762) TaxID=717646 RepID=M2N1V3_BAUPA|nr:uncharacterized protein BAUCODRAFT_159657 [Baudoinia panamericana UAMH 10762]EMC92944.1 hypothetical protein BAUCODRAFT_159657 [Baudoinia panamericana UAMH 10762]
MAASPAKATAPVTRRKPPVNIFNTKTKKKPVGKPLPAQTYTAGGQIPASGTQALAPQVPLAQASANGVQPVPSSEDGPKLYEEYPILISKSELMRGLHLHGFKLQSRVDSRGQLERVNPYDEAQFQRPVKLYRRRPQDKPTATEQSNVASDVDDRDREQREAKRAERQAEREANQLLIAPTGDNGKKPVKKKQQKKVEDVFYDETNLKNQERSQLRYEEARPWHLEDFEGKNKWVASFEKPLMNRHILFELSENGFTMVPVEKWYRMSATDRVKLLSDDKVEKLMAAKHRPAKWFRNEQEAAEDARREAIKAKQEKMRQAQRHRQRDEYPSGEGIKEEYTADVDEIDFDMNDEFADDDEGFIFGEQNDEDAKETEKKLRAEQRTANLPDATIKDADEINWIDEEREEKEAEAEERKRQKRIRKQLRKKEYRAEYDSDDERNQFESSSDDEDSEEERERLEEERKKEEAQKAAQNGDKSGTSSRGNNTPNGRQEKRLKRDAELSELSGNESSRKKTKLNGTVTAPNGARSLSPDGAAARRIPSGYGSGSDTDTSRAGRPRPKHNTSPPGSPHDGTPNRSPAGSPTGSRAGSPGAPPAPGPFPTLDEVKAAVPDEGITIPELIVKFKPRLAGKAQDFIAMVKQVGKQDPKTKGRIVPKRD